MSHTKFQHLMCVGSYDPLPSTFGPPIKTSKVKEPEVTVKDGFTRVDGKVVGYNPFEDPQQCTKLRTAEFERLAFLPYNYIYAIPLSIQKEDPSEQVLTLHVSKTRFQKSKNVEYQGNHTTLPGGHQHDEIAQHSVAGLDPSGKLPSPVEQPSGTFGLDLKARASQCSAVLKTTLWNMSNEGMLASYAVVYLQEALFKGLISEVDSYLGSRTAKASDKQPEVEERDLNSCLAMCHAIASMAASDMQTLGWTSSYCEWQINQLLSDELKTEIEGYLSPKTAQVSDNRSEENGIISALKHATLNGAASDRQAFLKEASEEINLALLQEIHKQESASVVGRSSSHGALHYADIPSKPKAFDSSREIGWLVGCNQSAMQITAINRSEELFHSVHTDTAIYLSEAARIQSLDLRAHWYMDGNLVHIGDTYCPATIGRITFSRGPRE